MNQFLIFLNLCQHAKNQFLPSVHSSDTVNFRVSSTNWPFLFLTILTPKIFNHFLICVNLCQHAKKSVNFICSFWYSQFQSPETRLYWPDLFLTMLNQKKILSTINFWEFVSTCKELRWFIDLRWRNGYLKILESEWLRPFWPISQEQVFF